MFLVAVVEFVTVVEEALVVAVVVVAALVESGAVVAEDDVVVLVVSVDSVSDVSVVVDSASRATNANPWSAA